MKELENLLDYDESLKMFNEFNIELGSNYDHITKEIRIRSKCNWHEHGEKSSGRKFFLNLENQPGTQSKVPKLISGNEEIVHFIKKHD